MQELLREREKKWRRLSSTIQQAVRTQKITPEAVYAYAELLMRDEDGNPITPAPHHKLWIELVCDTRIQKLLIICSPESAKTSWLISAYCGLHIGVFPEFPIVLGSVTTDTAKKRSISLRAMVKRPEWQRLFPNVLPVDGTEGMSWEAHQWSVAPFGIPYPGRIHPTLYATGTNGTVIGSRARLVLGDDLLDYDETRTSGQREKTWEWAHNDFFSRAMSGIGRIILIGNAFHHSDLYARCQDPKNGWVVCHIPILSKGRDVYATITWPDNWEHAMLGEPFDVSDPYVEVLGVEQQQLQEAA